MKRVFTILSIALSTIGFAQNEFAYNWHFGDSASIDFSSGTPVAGTSSIFSYEGCVSPSDNNGNLLFYSNGGDIHQQNDGFVWNSFGAAMTNGELFDTAGCYSAVQSSIVIPVPESGTQFYLFTMDCYESGPTAIAHYKGFRYSIIDMAMNGGLGEVTTKGIHIYGDTNNRLAEGLTATRHANGTDFWIMTHSSDQNVFYSFLLTQSGISAPNAQTIGANASGQMKFSHQGDRLAYGLGVYDFDNATGLLSNYRSIAEQGVGKAFSMDGRYLYSTNAFDLEQYDLNASNLAASKQVIFTGNMFALESPMGLQMGPDCKIYVAIFEKNYVGVINDPSIGGSGCNFVKNQVQLLSGTKAEAGLPSFIDSDFVACDDASTEEQAFASLSVSPNPSSGEIKVLGIEDHNARYQVIDAMGNLCQSGTLGNERTVDLSNLNDGFYLIRLFNENFNRSMRIVIRK